MSSRLPERVDPWRLADQGKTLEGRYALADMARLAPLLADATGEASFRLSFERDSDRRAIVRLAVDAVLRLTCQRCLEPLDHEVHSRFVLGVVSGSDEAQRLPDTYESLLAEEETVSPREIVEEELLLSVPSVARHEESCSPTGETDGAVEEHGGRPSSSPFAVLAGLRGRSDED